jgi:hypothetical protein
MSIIDKNLKNNNGSNNFNVLNLDKERENKRKIEIKNKENN